MNAGSSASARIESLEGRLLLAAAPPVDADAGLAAVGDSAYFSALSADSSFALWKSDGSYTGTSQVRSIQRGNVATHVPELIAAGDGLFFFAPDKRGDALWFTRGTRGSTIRLHWGSDLGHAVVGSTLYFITSNGDHDELWKSNGTVKGTKLVKDGLPSSVLDESATVVAESWSLYGGTKTLYMFARESQAIWASNGTGRGTRVVATTQGVDPLAQRIAVVGDAVVYESGLSAARQLWRCNARGAMAIGPGTGQIGSDSFTMLNGKLYYLSNGQVWTSNGTAAGTKRVCALPAPTRLGEPWQGQPTLVQGALTNLVAGNGKLLAFYSFVQGSNPDNRHYWGSEIWAINPATRTSQRIASFAPIGGNPSGPDPSYGFSDFTEIHGGVVFNVTPGNSAGQMYVSDGTRKGTHVEKSKGGTVQMQDAVDADGQLFFVRADAPRAKSPLWVWNYARNKAPRAVYH